MYNDVFLQPLESQFITVQEPKQDKERRKTEAGADENGTRSSSASCMTSVDARHDFSAMQQCVSESPCF